MEKHIASSPGRLNGLTTTKDGCTMLLFSERPLTILLVNMA